MKLSSLDSYSKAIDGVRVKTTTGAIGTPVPQTRVRDYTNPIG